MSLCYCWLVSLLVTVESLQFVPFLITTTTTVLVLFVTSSRHCSNVLSFTTHTVTMTQAIRLAPPGICGLLPPVPPMLPGPDVWADGNVTCRFCMWAISYTGNITYCWPTVASLHEDTWQWWELIISVTQNSIIFTITLLSNQQLKWHMMMFSMRDIFCYSFPVQADITL